MADLSSMRKQYHFWPGEEGLDAWDVDRLIDLASELRSEELLLTEIAEVDSAYWFDGRNPPTVRAIIEHVRLIGAVDMHYPIIVGPDGRVMDGMHRIARAILDGNQTIRATRLATLPEPDFRNVRPEDLPYNR